VSGLLVLARSRASADALGAAFRAAGEEGEAAAGSRIVRKQYVGLVAGALPADTAFSGVLTAPVVHVEAGNGSKGGRTRTTQAAVTAYEVTHSTARLSVVLLWPSTGRKHQLRQHTVALFGQGLLGDRKYGGAAAPSLPGIALHLSALALPASDGTGRVVLDPLPASMREVILAGGVPASALERCGAIAPGPPEAASRI
jgi:23S rRNA pseudouridine955/2504/2580 synthase